MFKKLLNTMIDKLNNDVSEFGAPALLLHGFCLFIVLIILIFGPMLIAKWLWAIFF